jgi:hypothetical protein
MNQQVTAQRYLRAVPLLLVCFSIRISAIDIDCLQVEAGSITVDERKPSVLQIENIDKLSCVCTPVRDSTYHFMGNEELLVNYYDCGAMRFFGRVRMASVSELFRKCNGFVVCEFVSAEPRRALVVGAAG